jgi:predicted HAD superfamily hydrolase
VITSVDVFDTILLRYSSSERRRFLAIARTTAGRLDAAGYDVDAGVLLRTRREAQFLCYRSIEMMNPEADCTLRTILSSQARLLGLPLDAVLTILERAEIDMEAASLRPNRRLLAELAAERARGVRVIAVSDTYLAAAHIAELFRRVVGDIPVDAIHTSADIGLTKRGGRIFEAVCQREQVAPTDIRHIGDDHLADLSQPLRAGLIAEWRPRPLLTRLLRKMDAAAFRLAYGAMP